MGAGADLDGAGGGPGSAVEPAAEDTGQLQPAAVQGDTRRTGRSRPKRPGPRQGSLGRAGGGRPLAEEPDQLVIAKAATCAHCRAVLAEADQRLHARYDKVELPPVRPVVTRVERYLGRCPCCGGTTLAPVPEGMEQGTPFGVSILALALYLRFTHAISYRRLTRLFLHLFALPISEGALDAPVPPRQAAVRRRGRRHPRPPAPCPGGLFRRDHGAGRWPDLLELGVPER